MDPNLRHCPHCGRLYDVSTGAKQCDECGSSIRHTLNLLEEALLRKDMENVEEIAQFTGLAPSTIVGILDPGASIVESDEEARVCSKCKNLEALPSSEYCLDCRFDMHKGLGTAVSQLIEKIETDSSRKFVPLKGMGVGAALAEKRERAGMQRFNPAPKHTKGSPTN